MTKIFFLAIAVIATSLSMPSLARATDWTAITPNSIVCHTTLNGVVYTDYTATNCYHAVAGASFSISMGGNAECNQFEDFNLMFSYEMSAAGWVSISAACTTSYAAADVAGSEDDGDGEIEITGSVGSDYAIDDWFELYAWVDCDGNNDHGGGGYVTC